MKRLLLLSSFMVGCDGMLLSGPPSLQEVSIFDAFPNGHCEIRGINNKLVTNASCSSLSRLVDPDSSACRSTGPVLGYFPDQAVPMKLCREDKTEDLASRDEIRFLAFGDTGKGENATKGYRQQTVAAMMASVCPGRDVDPARGCDFAIVPGDLIYPSGVRTPWDDALQFFFESVYAASGNLPFYLVPGNHDYRGNVRALEEYTHFSRNWKMPSRQFSIPGLPSWLNIVGIDSQIVMGDEGGREGRETSQQLLRESMCQREGWGIVYGHHPIASRGGHGSDINMARGLDEMVGDCAPDMYVSGHDHHQELTILEGKRLAMVQGAGGAAVRDVARIPGVQTGDLPWQSTWEQVFAAASHGFALITVTPQLMNIQLYDATEWLDGSGSSEPVFSFDWPKPGT